MRRGASSENKQSKTDKKQTNNSLLRHSADSIILRGPSYSERANNNYTAPISRERKSRQNRVRIIAIRSKKSKCKMIRGELNTILGTRFRVKEKIVKIGSLLSCFVFKIEMHLTFLAFLRA